MLDAGSPRERLLADLLRRYDFKKRKHRPATPAYDRTDAEALLEIAKEDVRDRVKSGMSVKDALEEVARARQLPFSTLENGLSRSPGFLPPHERAPPLSP
ncbi:MAG TPA: hypothetical protein VHK26_07455 [Methyloceanibacter sp.]|nr:hypothetical protein [Methyloceanibacter sp.]